MKIEKWLILILTVISLSSCITYKNTALFQDAKFTTPGSAEADSSQNINLVKLQPYDVLSIKIGTSKQGFDKLFQSDAPNVTTLPQSPDASSYNNGFMIDAMGEVTLPVIGKVNLLGKTIPETKKIILDKAKEYLTDPYIEVRFLSYKVQILGEIQRPGQQTISGERVTLLDALSLAGGLTTFADPKEVLIMRESNGKPIFFKLDLRKASTITSKEYKLMPNDLVVINPLRLKYLSENSSSLRPTGQFLSTVLTLFLVFYRL